MYLFLVFFVLSPFNLAFEIVSRRVALANTHIEVSTTGATPGSTVTYFIRDELGNDLSTAQASAGQAAYILVPNFGGTALIYAEDEFHTASKLLRIINAKFGFGPRLGFHIHAREEEASLIADLLQRSTVGGTTSEPPPPPEEPSFQDPLFPDPVPPPPTLKKRKFNKAMKC